MWNRCCPKKQKERIPATLKRLVWNAYIGETIGKTKCWCCKQTDITAFSFHCGHVISEKQGGSCTVTNLRPICQNCNSSMGTEPMHTFMKRFQ
jgi:5-methylcytosine-specific restriction endonuclease McrA